MMNFPVRLNSVGISIVFVKSVEIGHNIHIFKDSVKESPDSDKSVEPQPNSKKVTSPVATKEEPKLRRSKRVQQPNRKWEDFVCTTTSA
ncbi:hypothetical protein E3N88_32680 [Mikania micrantha]|uniref:Uncharacterized protein n=1 Tax=Mikania micrantha TaxID=192012 RepID=A0A5N6M983_9ASTR|nr:hypothetical protein E3N88_32680 [Mikania micrantha]